MRAWMDSGKGCTGSCRCGNYMPFVSENGLKEGWRRRAKYEVVQKGAGARKKAK